MRGIILAGGTGTRLDPLTRITNKHLLPVYDRPMIYYPIEQLVGAGIDRIMIVTGGNHAGEFLRLLGNGSAFGLKHLDYAYQERAGGIAEALGLAEYFAAGEPVVVMLGDNIFERSIAPAVSRFSERPRGACILLADVDNPAAYGVAEMDGQRLVRIIEKPAVPPSRLAVTGVYLYDSRVFDLVRLLRPSGRGELEITDVNNRYLELGELNYERAEGYWADCGESID
ncbi:MAG TPA: sugar phosphate nucleotidyltransferase, partial [Candidatus Limnocylindria bacterium]|nr:sugar phosphate nucleotidyltransferase [Candidatus Limnocylindria bacterium]